MSSSPRTSKLCTTLVLGAALLAMPQLAPAALAQDSKPNILFIMGDDIGWMQPRIYHRGLMVGETPNIDRIGNDGAIFMDYVAMQSCTSGRDETRHVRLLFQLADAQACIEPSRTHGPDDVAAGS